MPFSAYDSAALRMLSTALSEAVGLVRKSVNPRYGEAEISRIEAMLVQRLTKAYDGGERNPDTLNKLALEQVDVPPTASRAHGRSAAGGS
jgi:hypothetical protein